MNEIIVSVNENGFEYDIHSLVKAFYPECDVKVLCGEAKQSSSEGMPDIQIVFMADSIFLSVLSGEFETRKINIDKRMERAQIKSKLKLLIYECLCAYTGKTLPWGTLTGIRPTKIVMDLLNNNASADEIYEYMKDVYQISDEKFELSLDIAKREKSILDSIHYKDGYSLYIGIPFCPTTCLYCSFTSFPIVSYKKRIDDYLNALFAEIDFTADIYKDKILDSIYIGGGTPTTLEADELERLLSKITSSFDMSLVKEFTVEAGRPDSITKEKLEVMKKYNVTRMSVNPQTMNQKTLDFIGRKHTVEDTVNAFKLARECGFDNINTDIILGLPGESAEDVRYTIEKIVELGPDSLTVHSLAVKRASALSEWIKKNGLAEIVNTDETMEIATDGASSMGMVPYYLYRQKNMSGNLENVGFSKEGKYGIYNILIMEEVQTIVALGAGSVTKRVFEDGRIERCDNVKDVSLYIEKIQEMIERKRELLGRG